MTPHINSFMIVKTKCSIDPYLIQTAIKSFETNNFKTSLNCPTGSFFYDPWVIKEEFKGTVWETILNSLQVDAIGEARIIKLDIERCYTAHADIDDRWHLALGQGLNFLVDLENQTFHTTTMGVWYSMDAGRLHSAVNFSDFSRYQLVVRQLLIDANIDNSVNVEIHVLGDHGRYNFDQVISPWLNSANKDYCLNSFNVQDNIVKFNTTLSNAEHLSTIMPKEFKFTYV